jgi:serine protease Do
MRFSTRFSILVITLTLACDRPTSTSQSVSRPAVAVAPTASEPARTTVQLPSGRTIADVAEKVTPSVVNVFSEREVTGITVSPHLDDTLDGRAPHRERNLGSGIIVASDGVIITNHHLVATGDKIRVSLKDGRELDAKIIGSDPHSDVAVLRVSEHDLPAIEIADSSKIRIGDLVLAIGNPFGIGQTVTMGIISATGRANMGIVDYEDFIQTDAAINPGNSGGALVDMDGKLVGVNAVIASVTGGNQGIGFAIPSNMAMQVERAILAHGKVMRGWLGIGVQDITADLARSHALAPNRGVMISDIETGSPAARAGLSRGDVIVSIEGAPMNDAAQLRNFVALAGKGTPVRIRLERTHVPITVDVVLGEVPADRPGATQAIDHGMLSGVTVQPLDRDERERLGLPDDLDGVIVTHVEPASSAAHLGLREDDLVIELNRKPTPTVDAFRDAAHTIQGDLLLLVVRHGTPLFMMMSR